MPTLGRGPKLAGWGVRRWRLTAKADQDLVEIYLFTAERYGIAQAERYRESMAKALESLADNPGLGRSADALRPGLRRHEHLQHVVFYRAGPDGVLIITILHRAMRPDLHL